ncbi:unnamed protein product [Caenorhabditis sp. 36 PRJEB53466]|nr:unnamed protein product [Caenorhabditis sp. 36 PRJEB53466]
MDYEFEFNQFPVYLAIVPWFYMTPSLFIILRIFKVYWKSNWTRPEPGKNQHVFLVISLSQFTCFAFFVFDFLMLRLPATGIFTAKIAAMEPNQWLKMIFFFTFYINYSAMLFPFLMPVIRLMIVMFPKDHKKINTYLVRIAVPSILMYPICFTFFLIPAVGVCKQIGYPYPFGAIWIYYAGAAFGLRNSYFYLYNTLFWMIASILANVLLFFKVSKARAKLISLQKGSVSHRAETSITVTTLSMIAFYVTNGLFVLIYVLYYGTSRYMSFTTILRPFGNDMQTCIVSLVFYKTHPAFREPKTTETLVFSTSSFMRQLRSTS